MFATQADIAERAMDAIRAALPEADVFLRGSLAAGEYDELSDIDVGVRDSHLTDKRIADRVVAGMNRSFDVLFHDWARSLLPDACVITFFLAGASLHWNVDVEIVVPPGNRSVCAAEVEHRHPDGFLKVWVLTAKHLARSSRGADCEVERLYGRICRGDGSVGLSLSAKMGRMLESMRDAIGSQYPALLPQCDEFQKRLEQHDRK